MLKFFLESKNISNFINIQIVWFLHISLRNNYNNKFLWMSKKKLFIFHVSEERRAEEKKKKKPTATIRGGYSTQGYRKGDSLDGGQKRVSKFPCGDVPEFSQGGEGGDRMHPSAVPNCHIFHSNECETYICSLRSPRVDGPDKEEILEISSRK